VGEHQVVLVEDDQHWQRCEEALDRSGITLPLPHRRAWATAIDTGMCLLSVEDEHGTCLAAFAVDRRPTRAMPGHFVLRADRIGASNANPALVRAGLFGLHALARKESRIIRVEVGLFSRDASTREELRTELVKLGGVRGEDRAYTTTSAIDLAPAENAILAGFHATARRHIRAVSNKPVRIELIRDEALAPAMRALIAETRARTGGGVPQRPVEAWIALARRHPELLRIVGIFALDGGELLAFACGHNHGDHVVYSDAASLRRHHFKVPLGYAPVWELMRWGKRVGSRWFDFGGITDGSHDDAVDPLGGISDFKRYFRGAIEEVGEEWCFDLRPGRAWIARAAQRAADALRRRKGGTFARSRHTATQRRRDPAKKQPHSSGT
jgi:hypothetical protein